MKSVDLSNEKEATNSEKFTFVEAVVFFDSISAS